MVEYVKAMIVLFSNDEENEGQGLVEYALILVLISIAAIATMRPLGTAVSGVFSKVTASL